jgi:lysophospholipase L1-like esterase
MHARNPHGEIYVLNSLPFPPDTMGDFNMRADSMFKANLPAFNHMLDTAVTARRQTWLGRGEGGVWLVDAFDSLAKLPDSTWDSVCFSDYLHPNQTGYNRLGRAILDAMRIAGSSFLK